ncbi:hypothetical protein Esi_0030_0125 [Ectocarpus siliculosus]|uniref:F-box domain-containing protein n=1 Tax=Ectocarpus siliculosus TaxID=2880 RepID=D8LKK0_ECTSI|nr:hypothetical protein Esi_0030_0125 [Ectocarpus siliculosus]|eukprot:CBN74590.1 hypothetical protein Esi_0030_0125 [Ectocarpus siliculosus]
MDFVSNTSKRSGQMVQKIRQHFLTQLDTIPITIPTSTGAAPSVPGGQHDLEQQQQQQLQRQQLQLQQRQPLWSSFPLGLIPEDVRLTVLSFLPAGELSSIRRASRDFLQTADRHADVLWGRLNRCEFPSVSAPTGPAAQETNCLSPHQRRAALSTVVVDNDKVLFDFRRRGFYTGPVNFLPLSTLVMDNPTPLAPLLLPLLLPPQRRIGIVPAGTEDGDGREEGANLLPRAPESPAPAGFLGYAVRLLRLRPEHEPLRWTALFALFRDLAVFETTEQAEAVRARVPDRRLFYCALDHPGAQDEPCPPGGRSLPHISHWGFHGVLADSGLGGGEGEVPGVRDRAGETVGDALERQERTACFARSSLAFLQYGGGV